MIHPYLKNLIYKERYNLSTDENDALIIPSQDGNAYERITYTNNTCYRSINGKIENNFYVYKNYIKSQEPQLIILSESFINTIRTLEIIEFIFKKRIIGLSVFTPDNAINILNICNKKYSIPLLHIIGDTIKDRDISMQLISYYNNYQSLLLTSSQDINEYLKLHTPYELISRIMECQKIYL